MAMCSHDGTLLQKINHPTTSHCLRMKTLSHLRLVSHARHGFFGVILVIFAGLQINLIGQEILFQETFETDGDRHHVFP